MTASLRSFLSRRSCSTYSSKPWGKPEPRWKRTELATAKVLQPASPRTSESVTSDSGSTVRKLNAPCCPGMRPVNSVAWDGVVDEQGAYACSYSTPCGASAVSDGAVSRW